MAVCFFDTSALVKYYHDELGRQVIVSLADDPNNRIFISRLGLIEWHSAFFRLRRMDIFTQGEFQTIRTRFLSDIRHRKFLIQPLERTHQNRAIRLLSRYAVTQSLRTLVLFSLPLPFTPIAIRLSIILFALIFPSVRSPHWRDFLCSIQNLFERLYWS